MRRSTLAYSTMCLAINALTLRGTNNLPDGIPETDLPPGIPEHGDHSEPTCAEKLHIVRGLAQGERDPDQQAALAAKEAEVRAQCEGLELAETESGVEPTELAQFCAPDWGNAVKRADGWTAFFTLPCSSSWTCPYDDSTWLVWWCYRTNKGRPAGT